MKIAFITNQFKTILFHAISQQLEILGHEVFWISPSRRWSQWLKEEGISSDHLLDITCYGKEWALQTELKSEQFAELAQLEKHSGTSLNNIILMDRLLKEKPYNYAISYLHVCHFYIKSFIVKNNIKMVFSEPTWAVEIITILTCKQLGIYSYAPHIIRIPNGRFAFFQGYEQSKIAVLREPTSEDINFAESFLAQFLQEKPKPEYFHTNNKLPKIHLNWINKFVNHIRLDRSAEAYDETKPSAMRLIQLRLGEVINRFASSVWNPFETPELPPKKPFVLFTLHKQPESSIDVLGAYISNQLELIKALARSLPVGYELYVKEHSNAIGDRSIGFYSSVKQIPSVRLINPFLNSFSLIEHASLTISISGTVCYEAALLGKPAITLVPMFFSPILDAPDFNPYQETTALTNLLAATDNKPVNHEKRINYLAWIHANSFPGMVSDPVHQPRCISEENVNNLTHAFSELIQGLPD